MEKTVLSQRPQGLALYELLDTLPDVLLCVDDQREVVFQNAAARKIFCENAETGANLSNPFGLTLAGLLAQVKLPVASENSSVIGPIRSVEARVANGQRMMWEASWGGRTVEGRRLWLVAVREASHHQQIQNVVYQAQNRQVIGSLAAGIAHDFNNILAAVIANIDLALLDETISPGSREFLSRAQLSARRGAELNGKLLSFSRRSGNRPAPLDLVKITEEALFILRRSLEKKIQIQFQPPAGLWLAQADQNQIVQVLMNLCLNARDAMPRGGKLTILLTNATFPSGEARPPRRAGEFVRVTVADTGIGMPAEVLQRLFEPYFTTKDYGKGAGLSLSLASHVLAEHGGWMEVESRVGEGSQFHVFLPRVCPAEPSVPASPAAVPAAPPPLTLEGTETILMVDDEPSIRIVMRAVLQFRGYKVIEAVSGEEGLLKFQDGQAPMDLVLLDVNMPGLDGWETLARLRKLNGQMPVLMLSGGSIDDAEKKLTLFGAAGIVEKPFKTHEFLRIVRSTLDRAKKLKS